MSNLFWLTDAQMDRLRPFFPKSRDKPRVDDRRVLSGMIFSIAMVCGGAKRLWSMARQDALQPKEAVGRHGGLRPDHDRAASEGTGVKTVMIDATYLKAHRTASSLRAGKWGGDDKRGRLIGQTKGGLNTKLHAVTNARGRSLRFFMTAGQVRDYTGVAALLDSLPAAEWLIADRGYDADWIREASRDKGDGPVSRAESRAARPFDTTSGDTNGATGWRSCSVG